MQSYMPVIWIVFAIIMAVVEASTAQLVSVWFVIGAIASAVCSIFTDNVLIQILVFVGVSLAALLITRPLVKKLKKNSDVVATNAGRLIGETGVMLSDIPEPEFVGQAKVLGETWSVKCDNPPLATGEKVRVLAIEGVKLIVERI